MKVDEQFKCKDCDNYNQCKYYHNRRETSFICKEFQNQWGFIEELEKIKEKIDIECDSVDLALDVILDRIKELKGEADKEYEAKVITRGNCMMCGKELTEGLFICKECENKAESEE